MLSFDFQNRRPRPFHFFMASIGLTLIGVALWTFFVLHEKSVNTKEYQKLVSRFFYNEFIHVFYSSQACENTFAGKILTPGAHYTVRDIKDHDNNTIFTTDITYRQYFKIKPLRFTVGAMKEDQGDGILTITFEPDTKTKVIHPLDISYEIPLKLKRDISNNLLKSCFSIDVVGHLNRDYPHPQPPLPPMPEDMAVLPPVQTYGNPPRWVPTLIWPTTANEPQRTQRYVTKNIFYDYRHGEMKKLPTQSSSLMELDDGHDWAGASKIIFNQRGEVGYDGDRAALVLSAYTFIRGIVFDTTYENETYERLRITAEGRVGIGVEHPDSTLTVAGSISTPPVTTSYSTLDASLSNIFRLRSPASSFIQLNNMANGGKYTIVIEDITSRTYDFPACNGSTFWSPDKKPTQEGHHTIYNILALKNEKTFDCYIQWETGFK